MNWDFLILGSSGTQGKITTRALLEKGYTAFLADLYPEESDSLLKQYTSSKTGFEILDIMSIEKTVALIQQVQPRVVINCAEGDYNVEVYQACLKTKTHIIDLGSDIQPTIQQLGLHDDFIKAGMTAITGCGSTPGINNVMLKYAGNEFDTIEGIEAGFAWDSNVKEFVLPFSIGSIVYELGFPAPYIEDGLWKKVNPFSSSVKKSFDIIGEQECLLVDHPEIFTFELCYKDKGLKNMRFYASFPEHSLNIIKTLMKLGLSNEEPVMVERVDSKKEMVEISPLELLTQVLKKLPSPSGYIEKENLWVSITGTRKGVPEIVLMECVVSTLPGWEEAGSNINTGVTAAIIAEMIYKKEIDLPGSFVPEQIIPEDLFFKHIAQYGMKVYKNKIIVN